MSCKGNSRTTSLHIIWEILKIAILTNRRFKRIGKWHIIGEVSILYFIYWKLIEDFASFIFELCFFCLFQFSVEKKWRAGGAEGGVNSLTACDASGDHFAAGAEGRTCVSPYRDKYEIQVFPHTISVHVEIPGPGTVTNGLPTSLSNLPFR